MQAGLGWILGDIDESSNPQKLLGAELFLRGGSQGEGQKFFALGPGAEILHSRRVQVYIYYIAPCEATVHNSAIHAVHSWSLRRPCRLGASVPGAGLREINKMLKTNRAWDKPSRRSAKRHKEQDKASERNARETHTPNAACI